MRRLFRILFWPLLLLLWLPSLAAAQHTGGSFGGGSFGGGSHSYGGGSHSYGGGSHSYGGGSHSYGGGSSYSSSGGGGSLDGTTILLMLPFVVVLLIYIAFSTARERERSDRRMLQVMAPSPGSKRWDRMDITALRLGIDWRARRLVQTELERFAKRGDTKSPAGLARLLQQSAQMLQDVELAWLYAGVSNFSPMSPPQAEGIFRQLAIQARSRFKEELIRNADGRTQTREASALRAREHEGEGVVVVTLIVAARREIEDLRSTQDAQEIRQALGRLARLRAADMVALEVVWSPAADEDRMSTLELEALYPDLSLIRPSSIAGRLFCSHCTGPYAAELTHCPHCGAPNPRVERGTAS